MRIILGIFDGTMKEALFLLASLAIKRILQASISPNGENKGHIREHRAERWEEHFPDDII